MLKFPDFLLDGSRIEGGIFGGEPCRRILGVNRLDVRGFARPRLVRRLLEALGIFDDALRLCDRDRVALVSALDDLIASFIGRRGRGEQVKDGGRESVQILDTFPAEALVDAQDVVGRRSRIMQTALNPSAEPAFVSPIAKNL